ncbi:MAG TPA: hypothetical protein VMV29_15790 [Ktedonobacterales bacterium]|nr:hypothetical protein [Ktedonobacterales bacterium]
MTTERQALPIELSDIKQLQILLLLEHEQDDLIAMFEEIGPFTFETLLTYVHDLPRSAVEQAGQADPNAYQSLTYEALGDDWTPLLVVALLGLVTSRLAPDDERREAARTLLAPLLTGAHAPRRWVAALAMGALRDEQAFPVLLAILTELTPLPHTLDDPRVRRFSIFTNPLLTAIRYATTALLWRWGDPLLVAPAFRAALIEALRVEREIPRPAPEDERMPVERDTRSIPPSDGPWRFGERWTRKWLLHRYDSAQEPWLAYQEMLLYGLGRLGAFGALVGLEVMPGAYGRYGAHLFQHWDRSFSPLVEDVATTPITRWVFQVQIVMGALGREVGEVVEEALGIFSFSERPTLAKAVEEGLAHGFGLDSAQCQRCMECYEHVGLLNEQTNPTWITASLWRLWDEQPSNSHHPRSTWDALHMLASNEQPAPTDEQVARWLDERRMEKYGQ